MSEPDYNEIRRRVEHRFNKQKELSIHAAVYIVINLLIWGLYVTGFMDSIPVLSGLNAAFGILMPLFISIGWGAGLVAHYVDYYYSVGGGARRRERVIQDEIERERALRAEYEKPKRDRRVHLTEDGELEEVVDEDDYSRAEKRLR